MGARERESGHTLMLSSLAPDVVGEVVAVSDTAQQMEGLDVKVVVAAAPASAAVAMAAGTTTCLGEAVGDECEEVSKTKAEAP